MKSLLVLLCAFALVFSMELEVSQVYVNYYEYQVKEINAMNTSLQIIVMKDGAQYYVEDISEYDGLYRGKLTLRQPGQYVVTVINPETGQSAEATIAVTAPVLSEEFKQNFSAQQQQAVEEQISLPAEEIIPGLPLLIVGIAIVLIALLVFGNPLKKK